MSRPNSAGPPPAVPAPAGVVIRAATPRDARGIVELRTTLAAERRFIRTERVQERPRDLRPELRESWSRLRAAIVAIAGGVVVGHLSIHRLAHPATEHIATLGMGVAPSFRGHGVGAALLAEAFRWARWAGVEKLSLEVYPDNAPALALYQRFGFVEEGRLVGHSKKSDGYRDEIVMGRWL